MTLDEDVRKIAVCMEAVFVECKDPPLSNLKHLVNEELTTPYAITVDIHDDLGVLGRVVLVDYVTPLQGMTYQQYMQHGKKLMDSMYTTGMMYEEIGGHC